MGEIRTATRRRVADTEAYPRKEIKVLDGVAVGVELDLSTEKIHERLPANNGPLSLRRTDLGAEGKTNHSRSSGNFSCPTFGFVPKSAQNSSCFSLSALAFSNVDLSLPP